MKKLSLRSVVGFSASLLFFGLVGCGGKDPAPDDNGGGGEGLPADTSAGSMDAFITASKYTETGWTADGAGPRPGGIGTVHGRVKVWMNAAGAADPVMVDGMAVKEIYDEAADTVLGHAAIWRVGADAAETAYYCKAPGGRCTGDAADTEVSGEGSAVSCHGCHGGNIFTGH
jgi:hypothetical protein